MRRNQPFMASSKCDKCGAVVSDQASACPACGASVPPVAQTSLPRPKSNARRSPILAGGIVVAALLAVLLFAISNMTPTPPMAKPEVAEPHDLEGTRAKAERGEADAQKNLGKIYAKGDIVKLDYKEAAKWYRLAAD